MTPIRRGDGTTLPPKNVTEVRTGDGRILYSSGGAGPSSGIARLTLDDADTSGSTALDVWNGNDATIFGATTGVSGANQTYSTAEGYSFDGSNDHLESTITLPDNSAFSVALWGNPVAENDYHGMLNSYDSDATQNGFSLEKKNDNTLRFFTYDSGSLGIDINSTATIDGVWGHYVATYDGSDVKLYLDGSEVASASGASISHNVDVYIGLTKGSTNYFAGDLDDIRAYSKSLSSTEVSDLYNTGSI